jgi:pyruvate/2-oxoglutarate dehydrogenase complex dihydrolipoamide acyltransferase (E2) component
LTQPPAPTYQVVGTVGQIDNSKNYRPTRISITDAQSGQERWYSAFEGVGKALEQGGQNSGPWQITYSERPWARDGRSGINYTIDQAVLLQGQPQAPAPAPAPAPAQAQPAPQPAPVQQAPPQAPPQASASPSASPKDRLIVRQVAAKLAVTVTLAHADGMDYNTTMRSISLVTDDISAIILGEYVMPPQAADPQVERVPDADSTSSSTEEFVQQEF